MAGVDLTVYAEALIGTVARAFYDDDVVCLIDVLLRDKFLRDDDMSVRLSLPIKQLRRTLQFLEEQHLVKHELVDDLSIGGSQNTKFWYIDYNHAVHVIRLRVHLLQKKLERDEMRARSSSMYLCPGYASRTCNGRYTETEAQQIVDTETGLFLCRECLRAHANNPNAPGRSEYTLKLLDNQRELKSSMDNARRVRVQLSSKVDQDQGLPLRAGIFDLLQKVRGSRGADPTTSNLPSENISMGIGSKRLAGTGRTKGTFRKKQIRNGLIPDEEEEQQQAGGPGGPGGATRRFLGGARRTEEGDDELTFLKNAMGQEIAFELERGGGARANLLATKGQVRNKLVDAAAMKVGVDLGLVARVILATREQKALERKRKMEGEDDDEDGKKKKKKRGGEELDFLQDNLGIDGGKSIKEREIRRLRYLDDDEDESTDESDDEGEREGAFVSDETDELRNLPDDEMRAAFQAQYKVEVARQKKILGLDNEDSGKAGSYAVASGNGGNDADFDDGDVVWEDG